ncbi:sex-lethal homolog isoform X1 [Leptopilina boulardi]|uniref:sex-lethal homolog isoform X1 n=2 Tax=Leptopilina boulardi TaxID=63433 RepID=UPI0021F5CF1C|nr:sex-lethal homolog isoform X1 [Leptopilina boulardi]
MYATALWSTMDTVIPVISGGSGSGTNLQQQQPQHIPVLVTPTIIDQRIVNGTACPDMTDHQRQQQQQLSKGNGMDSRTNLIINYLPQSMTEKELYSMFVTIGPVESCRVMKDYKTGYSYGFGFVNYAKIEDADTAIATLNGLQVQNKKLKVSHARPSGEEIKETNLYVTNLPRNTTDKQIEDIFSKFGNIVQKNILKDKHTGLPRGVAFVRYDKREEAQEAINFLNGTIPDGGSEPLSVKIAEEHGKQKAAYYAGWQAGYNQSRGGGMAGRGRGGPPVGVGMGAGMPGIGAGGPPGIMGRSSGFGPRGGHHFGGGGVGGGPGAMRMEKMHPHRFNPIGMSGGISGGGGTGGGGGGYGASNFW